MLSNNVFKNGGGVLRGCFFFVFPLVMIPFHQQVKLNQSANFLLVLLAFNNLLFSFCWRWSFILELLYTESRNFVGQNAQNCQLKKNVENAKNTKMLKILEKCGKCGKTAENAETGEKKKQRKS